ncbi:hypothetical protein Dolphis_67 [Pseudomonas phage Dolphis]|nr:hypothetical protein Dolphis_67 [Pseudomonas phage Dolphis]
MLLEAPTLAGYILVITLCTTPARNDCQVFLPENDTGVKTLTECEKVKEIMLSGSDGKRPLRGDQSVILECEPAA